MKLRQVLGGLVLVGWVTAHAAAPARPNVLLIISDEQGYGDLSLHGNPHVQTPNLDRLPREEVYEMEWHTLAAGKLTLARGKTTLTVEALTKPGAEVMQLKSVLLERMN